MDNLQVFVNQDFGEIRVVIREGEPWFVAKDVAAILGYNKTSNMLKLFKDKEKISISCGDLEGSSDEPSRTHGGARTYSIISEPGLYRCIFGSTKPEAERFKDWVYYEVLPSIRKTGSYSQSKVHPLVRYAEETLEIAKQYAALEEEQRKMAAIQAGHAQEICELQAKTAAVLGQSGYYSIMAYAHLKNRRITIKEAAQLGKQATKLSLAANVPIGKIPDPRFGEVNTYHLDVLHNIFREN